MELIKNIEFKRGKWEDFFQYAHNERFPFTPQFIQDDDCITNGKNPEMKDGYDYTTIFTKEMYGAGTKIWLTCSFDAYGAPLITLTDTLNPDSDGNLRYGVCQEFIIWENGINSYEFFMSSGELKWHKTLGAQYSLAPVEKHEVCLEVMEKYVCITIDEDTSAELKRVLLRVENLPERFYIGITGCENINRLYRMKISSQQ